VDTESVEIREVGVKAGLNSSRYLQHRLRATANTI
jgi:hypothetical protein